MFVSCQTTKWQGPCLLCYISLAFLAHSHLLNEQISYSIRKEYLNYSDNYKYQNHKATKECFYVISLISFISL